MNSPRMQEAIANSAGSCIHSRRLRALYAAGLSPGDDGADQHQHHHQQRPGPSGRRSRAAGAAS